jgi:C-terminal processing protease CtpA/Prc
MTLTERDRRDILTKVERLVGEKFYEPNFKGHDWPVLVSAHRDAILKETEVSSFEAEVNKLLRELGSSGLGLISTATRISPKNAISATFRDTETEYGRRWVFQDVHAGGPAASAGIAGGDVLICVGEADIAPPEKPLFAVGQAHQLVLEKPAGRSQVTVAVPAAKHAENPCAVPDRVKAHTNDGVAVVRIPLFPGKLGIDFAEQVREVFDAQLSSAKRLVVDLRGNPGGGVGCLRLMSLLTPGKKPVGFSLDRAMAVRGYDRDRLPRFDRVPRSKIEVPWLAMRFAGKKSVVLVTEGLGRKTFHNRVVVLINEHTTCASEMVALFAREETGATIVGSPTPGRLVTHTGSKLGHGFTLALPIAAYMSWAGTRLDGTGLAPDVPADWSYSDARRGLDTQLAVAITVAKAL